MRTLIRPLMFVLLLSAVASLWRCSCDAGNPTSPGKTPIDTVPNTACGKPVCPDTTVKTPCGLPVCPDTTIKTPCGLPVCPDTTFRTPCGLPVCADSIPPGLDTSAARRQAEALADTAFAQAMAFLRQSGPAAEMQIAWVNAPSESSGYAWSVRQLGMYRRIHGRSIVRAGPYAITRNVSALAGRELAMDEYPAIGLTNSYGNMVLALNAEVSGPVLLTRGDVRKSTDYNVRYTGRTSQVTVWDSSAAIWKGLPLRFPAARAWDSAMASELSKPNGPGPDASWDSTAWFPDPISLPPGVRQHQRILCKGKLILGDGVDLRDCLVAAGEIAIQGDARIEGGAVFSAGKMAIVGEPNLKSQFLSRDVLRISMQAPLKGFPLFYAEGRASERTHTGSLQVSQAQGEGIFLADTYPAGTITSNLEHALVFGAATDLKGFASTDHVIDARGRFRGCVLADNLGFVLGETTWIGHLAYGDFGLADVGLRLAFPATEAGREPLVLARRAW
jgi:hypothetical protein